MKPTIFLIHILIIVWGLCIIANIGCNNEEKYTPAEVDSADYYDTKFIEANHRFDAYIKLYKSTGEIKFYDSARIYLDSMTYFNKRHKEFLK